jgi:hypothetical protein
MPCCAIGPMSPDIPPLVRLPNSNSRPRWHPKTVRASGLRDAVFVPPTQHCLIAPSALCNPRAWGFALGHRHFYEGRRLAASF